MWLIFSFTNALASGVQNAYYKKASSQINPILMAWSILVISSLLFSPLLLFGIPTLNTTFWIAVAIRLILDSIAFTLYIKGIQKSPLSVTVPMLSLVPLFSIVTVFTINHLLPSPLGFLGILTTVFGIYFLNFDHDTKHILSPFTAVYKEKGVLYIAIAAVLWSIVISLQKLAIDNSNPTFYTASFQLIWAVLFAPVAYFSDKKGFIALFQQRKIQQVFPIGLLDAVQVYTSNLAYMLALPIYVNAVGNSGILFSSFFAWYFFKEKIHKHIIPTIIIVIGITLIGFAQK